MNFSVKCGLVLLFQVFTVYNTIAQDFLLTTRGDTIQGKIKPLLYGAEKKVQVNTGDKKKVVYSMFDTRYYHYDNEDYYPVKGPNGYTFMKLVKSGYLSVYAFQLPGQLSYDGLMLVKRDATSMEVPNLGFRRHMSAFLEDCAKVSGKIDRGELDKKDLVRIVEEYNQCVENQEPEPVPVQHAGGKWDDLENAVRNHADFEEKNTALDMITEIKNKMRNSERVPPFLINGLKQVLADQPELQNELTAAVSEIDN